MSTSSVDWGMLSATVIGRIITAIAGGDRRYGWYSFAQTIRADPASFFSFLLYAVTQGRDVGVPKDTAMSALSVLLGIIREKPNWRAIIEPLEVELANAVEEVCQENAQQIACIGE